MPILSSDYKGSFYTFKNGFLETVLPNISNPSFFKEEYYRIPLENLDFLSLYHCNQNADKAIILTHGLEGNAHRPYMQRLKTIAIAEGWDIWSWDMRSCRKDWEGFSTTYHSGRTDDLERVFQFVKSKEYQEIATVGISMGGNITLKWVSEYGNFHSELSSIAVLSVPLHLRSACEKIDTLPFFRNRFLKSLLKKGKRICTKTEIAFKNSKTILAYDDHYTAPMHGFSSAVDYYEKSSSLYVLSSIKKRTFILQAENDPFLSPMCFPKDSVQSLDNCFLEVSNAGGHVGFGPVSKGYTYAEGRIFSFFKKEICF